MLSLQRFISWNFLLLLLTAGLFGLAMKKRLTGDLISKLLKVVGYLLIQSWLWELRGLMVSLQTVVPLSLFSLILLITVCKGSLETTDEGSYDLNIYLDFLLFLLSCDSWGLTVSSHLWTHRSSLSKAVEQELREWFAARRSTFPFFYEQLTGIRIIRKPRKWTLQWLFQKQLL